MLNDRQIAITGAASGMGLATAKLIASRGGRVALADINTEALKSAIASLIASDQHKYYVVDVRSGAEVDAWIDAIVKDFGQLDGAVNMAGIICKAKPVTEVTDDDWDFSFAVNTKGVFNCLRAQLRAMSHGGSIVSRHDMFLRRSVHPLQSPTNMNFTGLGRECLRPIWCRRQCCLLCLQSCGDRSLKDCGQREPTHQSQLRRTRLVASETCRSHPD